MLDFDQGWINDVFTHLAYSPFLLYSCIIAFMVASGFGVPIPEEVTLIAAGFVGHMAKHPELYPPPEPGAARVNVFVLAAVSLGAVIGSDFLIYSLGRRYGPNVLRMKFFARFVKEEAIAKIRNWVQKYGYWAVIIFRFTPGVRFPGHLMCGMMGLSRWKFLGVDLIAAGISVPTQVLLVSYYGEEILAYFKQFKIYLFCTLLAALIIFVVFKLANRSKKKPIAYNAQ